jgi:hypothetical protein
MTSLRDHAHAWTFPPSSCHSPGPSWPTFVPAFP